VPDVAGNASLYSGYPIIVYGARRTGGGTSAVAPLYASLIAILAANVGWPLGYLNPLLYEIAFGPRQQTFVPMLDEATNALNPTVLVPPNNQAPVVCTSYGSTQGVWNACTGLGRIDGTALLAVIEAGRRSADQTLADELSEARRDYCLAVHRAWVDATLDWRKAYAVFAAAQHRITLDARLRQASAYRAWFRSAQDARPEAGGSLPGQRYETYHRAIEEAVRTERNDWDQAQQAYRLAQSAVTEAHITATQDALKTYLAQIQAIWGRTDIASADAVGLAHLAWASGHAAQAVRALQWGHQ
jgi:hypothetical protein